MKAPQLLYFLIQIFPLTVGIYLRYVDRQILFQELPSECDVEGGNVLMRNEPEFDNLGTTNIPTGKEFWLGDLLYTPWILPIDCIPKPTDNVGVMVTSELFKCYEHCISSSHFVLQLNFCLCLDYDYQAISSPYNKCNQRCNDIGLCGGYSSNGMQYVSVYDTVSVTFNLFDVRVESPNDIGVTYIECLTGKCNVNDMVGVNCNTNTQRFGLCASSQVTSIQKLYNDALISCINTTGTYLAGHCDNTTVQNVWLGPVRFSFAPQDGYIPWLNVAKGAKCTKQNNGYVNCIPTTEVTNLPFVCKMGKGPKTNPVTTEQTDGVGDNDGGGSSSTDIVVGCVVGVSVVCLTIVAVVYIWRKKKSKFSMESCDGGRQENSKSVYEQPRTDEVYDHIYTESTGVYHPYLELYDDNHKTTSGESSENGRLKTSGESNKSDDNVQPNSNTSYISFVNIGANSGYEEPIKTQNFGRKLPQIPGDDGR